MEHTKGPWTADDGECGQWGIFAEDLQAVAYCMEPGPSYKVLKPEQTEANARLICAAPDLLEALEQIAEGKGRFSMDRLTHAENTIEDMKAIARQAIAKVKEA